MYTYSYLIGDLSLLLIWLVLFLWRKEVRTEMLVVSSVFGAAAIFTAELYVQDWWHPLTITGTPVGIEDVLFGFVFCGIAAVIYEEVFKKKLHSRKPRSGDKTRQWRIFVPLVILFGCFFGGKLIFQLSTFEASALACLFTTVQIWYFRRDLIMDSLFSGVLAAAVLFISYWAMDVYSPGWIQRFYYPGNFSNIIVMGAPLGDIIYGFLVGLFIGPLYEYWQEARLVRSGGSQFVKRR